MAELNTSQLYERLVGACSLATDDAALRISTRYEPAAGPAAKVFPPSYPSPTKKRGESIYLTEHRYVDGAPVEAVLLDAHQSQANRCEEALLRAARSGQLELPHLALRFQIADGDRTITGSLTSLEAPHRSRDAYFRDSHLDDVRFDETEVGRALAFADTSAARPFVEHAPADVVFGTWDSHRGRRRATRFPRIYASEIIGLEPQVGLRGGARMDPNVLPQEDSFDFAAWDLPGKGRSKLSQIGHGMVPPTVNPREYDGRMAAGGGVAVSSIRRLGTLSFAGLAAVSFGPFEDDEVVAKPARALLAALALLADRLAFSAPALTLRSGSDLVLVEEQISWVRRGAELAPLTLDIEAARGLFDAALGAARAAGLRWDGTPVELAPRAELLKALTRALTTVDLTQSAD